MHLVASPLSVELPHGEQAEILVTITNTSTLIDAYAVRVFGLDPQWVDVDRARLSLFPGETGAVPITVALPTDFPAGVRQLAIHVQGENDGDEFALAQVALAVGTRPRTTMRVDPVSVTGGNRALFALIIANEGNATVQERPLGTDPADVVDITFDPPVVVLPPQRREVVQADVRGGRPWFGQPTPRVLQFQLDRDSPPVTATFVQKPRIGRWLISLLGLITVAAIFAVVLSQVLENVVEEASVDERILNEALAGGGDGGETVSVTPSSVEGKVVLGNGAGVSGVQVELYSSGNGTVAVATAATDPDGAFNFGRLSAGIYRVRFIGAGFTEQWYAGAVTFADATDVEVEAGKPAALDDLELGGRPGSVRGMVLTDDPSGAVARLVVPGTTDGETPALVGETEVSADGSFLFEDVPSPATYQLIVEKEGSTTEVRDVVLSAAQQLQGIEILLRDGDGVIAGRVDGPAGPLGGVDVVATDGTLEVTTVSLTLDDIGAYVVRGLPTPGQYTLSFTIDGFTSETRTVTLGAGQQLADQVVTLTSATGSIAGVANEDGVGPAGGVVVTATGGDTTLRTVTASQAGPGGVVGSYGFESLPIPATYTLTFSKEGYVSQTRLVELDARTGAADATGVDATLVRADARVRGTVRDVAGTPVAGAALTLTDGTTTLQSASAHDPLGRFDFTGVRPGTYTLTASLPGTSPSVELVNVLPAETAEVDIGLASEASLTGLVQRTDPTTGLTTPVVGIEVRLYRTIDFPGSPSSAVATVVTDAEGRYTFTPVDAPVDYTVAIYASAGAPDPLDSTRVQSQPSQRVGLAPFELTGPN